jgi:hypothetical protein
MDSKHKVLALARRMGFLRPRDVEAAGIHREYLLRAFSLALNSIRSIEFLIQSTVGGNGNTLNDSRIQRQ